MIYRLWDLLQNLPPEKNPGHPCPESKLPPNPVSLQYGQPQPFGQ